MCSGPVGSAGRGPCEEGAGELLELSGISKDLSPTEPQPLQSGSSLELGKLGWGSQGGDYIVKEAASAITLLHSLISGEELAVSMQRSSNSNYRI